MRRKWLVASISLTLLAAAASALLYPLLPESVPMHWDIHGQVDGWGAKGWAAFLMPGVMALLAALSLAAGWLSPKRFEVDGFRSTWDFVILSSLNSSVAL